MSRLAALALLAVVMVAGCSGGSSSRTVASLPGSRATPGRGSTKLTVAQSDQDMVSFARCMRAHGVQMSDPFHRPGHSGLSIDMPTRDAATAPAYRACEHVISRDIQAKLAGARPESPRGLASLTSYARCMRAHDIGMLDPTSQGELSLGNVPGITSDFGRYSPQFRAADGTCKHLLRPTVHDDGTGP